MNKSIPLFIQGWPDEFVCMQVKNQANKQARTHTASFKSTFRINFVEGYILNQTIV